MGETRTVRSLGAVVLGCAFLLSATACSGETRPVPSSTRSSAETDAARLSAAVDSFAAFNAVLDGYVGGSKTVEAFEPLVTRQYFETLVAEDTARDTGTLTVGASSFSDEKLVDPDAWGGFGDLSLVVCLDTSRTEVVTTDGNPASTGPRQTRIPLIIYFETEPDDRNLLVNKVDKWNEEGFCS